LPGRRRATRRGTGPAASIGVLRNAQDVAADSENNWSRKTIVDGKNSKSEPLVSLRPLPVYIAFLGVLLASVVAWPAGDPPVPVGQPVLRQVIDHAGKR
jgi:hypothetical protein